ncbi:MAG TPA: HAMP domain-containing sensor histidine kinase [Candidatus Limnocylindria bacterium]|nr:HAMP domain-containing sensor histidine kinase [Candidatus Limnocylindria bacterium]
MSGNRGPAIHAGDARLLSGVRWRLVLFSAGSTLVLLVVLGSALYFSTQASLAASATTQLEARVADARRILLGQARPEPDEDDEQFGQFLFGGPASGTALLLFDAAGRQVLPEATTISPDLPVGAGFAAALDGQRDLRTATISIGAGDEHDTPVRVLSEAVDVGGETYVLQVLQDRSTEARTLSVVLAVLAIGGLAALLAAAGFGFLYAGRALVPIRESLRRQREFAADASHELRNPLAVIRGSVERLRRHADRPVSSMADALDDVEAEVRQLTGLVDDLLMLARSDTGAIELQRVPVDLADLAGEALGSVRPVADQVGVRLRLDAAPAPLVGDPDRLRQVVVNLADNAVRHSPTGGTVTVTVRGGRGAHLLVEDEGAGIRDADLPHVFDRFWRASGAPAGGTGLGLAIVAWIVERHGGRVRAANRQGSQGARFEVRLPA